jgi:hypothetical protein
MSARSKSFARRSILKMRGWPPTNFRKKSTHSLTDEESSNKADGFFDGFFDGFSESEDFSRWKFTKGAATHHNCSLFMSSS